MVFRICLWRGYEIGGVEFEVVYMDGWMDGFGLLAIGIAGRYDSSGRGCRWKDCEVINY